jgi:hypothetical protein
MSPLPPLLATVTNPLNFPPPWKEILESGNVPIDAAIDPMDSAKASRQSSLPHLHDMHPPTQGGIKNKELSGRTALSLAARYGHDSCIELLLKHKASVEKQQHEVDFFPLLSPLHNHHPDCNFD